MPTAALTKTVILEFADAFAAYQVQSEIQSGCIGDGLLDCASAEESHVYEALSVESAYLPQELAEEMWSLFRAQLYHRVQELKDRLATIVPEDRQQAFENIVRPNIFKLPNEIEEINKRVKVLDNLPAWAGEEGLLISKMPNTQYFNVKMDRNGMILSLIESEFERLE